MTRLAEVLSDLFGALADRYWAAYHAEEQRRVQAGARAACRTVRDALKPGQAQESRETCLLAHGIDCPRCGFR